MARLARSQFTALHDTVMAGASFVAALYLRLGDAVFWQTEAYLWEGTFAFAAIAAVVFLRTGVYRGVWRYASLPDLYALARASTWTVLIFLPVIFLVFRAEGFPRSAIVINWFTLMAFTGAPRLIYRVVKDGSLAHVLESGGASPNVVPVVLLGADDEAEQFARAMARTPEAPYVVTAMIDPTGRRAGQYIRGLDVLDGSAGLDAPLERAGRRGPRPQRLLLTSGSARPRGSRTRSRPASGTASRSPGSAG